MSLRNPLLKLKHAIREQDAWVGNRHALHIYYFINLLREANVANVSVHTALQYGAHHNTFWKDDVELATKYTELNRKALIDWNVHNWIKGIRRCIQNMESLTNTEVTTLIPMAPAMRHSVETTLRSFLNLYRRERYVSGLLKSPIKTDMEVLATLLEGINSIRNIHMQADDMSDIQAGESTISPMIFDELLSIRNTLDNDNICQSSGLRGNSMSINTINETLHWFGTVLSVFFHLIQFRSFSWYRPSMDLDGYFKDTIKNGSQWRRSVEAVRYVCGSLPMTPELAIGVLYSPTYLEDTIRGNTQVYGDTTIEKFVILDFLVAQDELHSDPNESGLVEVAVAG